MFTTLAILTFIASFIGTLAGFGSSVIMLPIVLLLMPLQESLLLVGFVRLFNDVWEIFLFKGKPHWKTLIIFGVTGIVASFLGANLVFSISSVLLTRLLGILLVIIALIYLINKRFKIPSTNFYIVLGGSVSGFISGIIGMGGPFTSLFLSGLKLTKTEYIFTMGVTLFFIDITRIITYLADGARLPQNLTFSLFLIILISLLAAEIAKHIVDKIPQELFQYVISLFLLLAGIKFLVLP